MPCQMPNIGYVYGYGQKFAVDAAGGPGLSGHSPAMMPGGRRPQGQWNNYWILFTGKGDNQIYPFGTRLNEQMKLTTAQGQKGLFAPSPKPCITRGMMGY